jgi:cell division protein FtsQ
LGRKHPKKKSKFGYYLYAVTVFLLTVVNLSLAIWLLTYVQSIHIRGTEYSNKSEILEWVKEDPMTINSLYTLWKFKSGAYKLPVYLEDVELQMTAPWSMRFIVREKEPVGCVLEGNEYHCFDPDGLVLKKTDEYVKDIPIIEGMEVESADRFEYLKVKDKQIFSYVVSLTEEMSRNELHPDRILWQEDSMDLFFGDVCVKLGKSNYEEKLSEIPPILEKLDGKKGILHLEHYTKGSTISFEENKEES